MKCPRCRSPIPPGESVANGKCKSCPKAISQPGPFALTVVLPLPDRKLMPNARVHHMARARCKKKAREMACDATSRAMTAARMFRSASAAEVQIKFQFRTNRKRDRDNLLAWVKSHIDGIADAGVIADDSGFTYPPVAYVYEKGCVEMVTYEIREIDEARKAVTNG